MPRGQGGHPEASKGGAHLRASAQGARPRALEGQAADATETWGVAHRPDHRGERRGGAGWPCDPRRGAHSFLGAESALQSSARRSGRRGQGRGGRRFHQALLPGGRARDRLRARSRRQPGPGPRGADGGVQAVPARARVGWAPPRRYTRPGLAGARGQPRTSQRSAPATGRSPALRAAAAAGPPVLGAGHGSAGVTPQRCPHGSLCRAETLSPWKQPC